MEGGLVFISHSHYDIPVVREIRNRFEQLGFEPLVFYLKCLNDSSEIESLIKREIDEREWFVFVDSENSRRSAWVKSECEYISGLKGKKIFTVNADKDINQQVDRIARQLQVYISFAARDMAVAETLKQYLIKRELRAIISVDELRVGVDFATTVREGINTAAASGFMLLIVTENTPASAVICHEIKQMKKQGGIIIPVYFNGGSLSAKQLKALGEHEPVYVDELSQQSLDTIVDAIEQRIDCHRGEVFDLSVFD